MKKGCLRSVLAVGMVVFLGAAANAKADGPSTQDMQDRLERLEHAVSDLTRRLGAVEQQLSGGAGAQWSCVAQCGGFSGTQLYYHHVSGSGATVALAFNALIERCSAEILFNGVETRPNGSRSVIPANIQNSCVRNGPSQ